MLINQFRKKPKIIRRHKSELEAIFNTNVLFKDNSINLFYHTQMSEFDINLNATVLSKSFKLNKVFANVWRR